MLLKVPCLGGAWRSLREDTRLLTATLVALNSFLLANGTDVASRCGDLNQSLHPIIMRPLRQAGGRDHRLREAAVTYLRAMLQLGTLQEGPWLGEALSWAQLELQRSKW